jgi:hypothetical protein
VLPEEQELHIMMSEDEKQALDDMLDRGLLASTAVDQEALDSIARMDTLQGHNVETNSDFETVKEFEAAVAHLEDLAPLEIDMAEFTKLVIEERIKQSEQKKQDPEKVIKIEPDEAVLLRIQNRF